jgi:glucose-6-phosphate isomerase
VITTTSSWTKLVALGKDAQQSTLSGLFLGDAQRAVKNTLHLNLGSGSIIADFSKQNITPEVVDALLELAQEASVSSRRDAMFAGAPINTSEGQPALHVALRAPSTQKIVVDGRDVVKEVHEVRRTMADFATGVRNRKIVGATGKPFTHIINVGIDGHERWLR